MTTEERLDRLDRIVDSLAASVVYHDDQIDKLLEVAGLHEKRFEKLDQLLSRHDEEIAEFRRVHAEAVKLFEAYLTRLPAQ